MTDNQYYLKYYMVITALTYGVPMRTISKEYNLGLSTVMRLKKRFFKKYRPSRALWGTFLKKVALDPHFYL